MNPLRRAFVGLERRRARRLSRLLVRHLEPGSSLLDLGCGSLIVAEQLQAQAGVRVTGLEILDYRGPRVPLVLYDGIAAPFRDRSFDCVLVAFVLHHCTDGGIAVLREALRLARKRVIVLEDRYDGRLERLAIRVVDTLLNRMENPAIPTPHRFRSTAEWVQLWGELGMAVDESHTVRTTPIFETPQTLFVLRPRPTSAGPSAATCRGASATASSPR